TPASIRALPGVAEAVGGQIEVLLDGGIRRGSDVVKGLAPGGRGGLSGRAPPGGRGQRGGRPPPPCHPPRLYPTSSSNRAATYRAGSSGGLRSSQSSSGGTSTSAARGSRRRR